MCQCEKKPSQTQHVVQAEVFTSNFTISCLAFVTLVDDLLPLWQSHPNQSLTAEVNRIGQSVSISITHSLASVRGTCRQLHEALVLSNALGPCVAWKATAGALDGPFESQQWQTTNAHVPFRCFESHPLTNGQLREWPCGCIFALSLSRLMDSGSVLPNDTATPSVIESASKGKIYFARSLQGFKGTQVVVLVWCKFPCNFGALWSFRETGEHRSPYAFHLRIRFKSSNLLADLFDEILKWNGFWSLRITSVRLRPKPTFQCLFHRPIHS